LSNLKKIQVERKEEKSNSKVKVIGWGIAVIVVLIFIFGGPVTGFYLFGLPDAPAGDDGRPYKGNPDAKILVVEYSDFQCPACGAAYSPVKNIVNEFQDEIRFEYRHFPLSYHIFAFKAAVAAEAAGDQGKFWEYHNKLYENQEHLLKEDLIRYAEELDLDMEKFKAVLESNEKDELIIADSQQGRELGVGGTPSFFVNGKKVSASELRQAILDELNK